MLPLETVLCPTDFSEPSLYALNAAVELCEHFGARLVVLHALEPLAYLTLPPAQAATGQAPLDPEPFLREQRLAAQANLEEIVREHVPSELRSDAILADGKPAETIVAQAERMNTDLIVIATHGQTGWRRLLFGSVAEKVVRLAERPVLSIQPPHDGEE